jgi:hypothetical protein
MVGLLALAFAMLPLAPGQAHALAGSGIPCLHQAEAPAQSLVSFGDKQLPCDGHHCAHGPFCCLSSCLAFTGLAVVSEVSVAVPLLDLAVYSSHCPLWPDGRGLRPALPPPRANV